MDAKIIAVVVAAGAGMFIASRLQGKKNAATAATIEPLLRERGPLTLPALMEAAGMKGFAARGKLAMVLNEMAAAGRVEIIPAPEGTPQMKKIELIKYQLRA